MSNDIPFTCVSCLERHDDSDSFVPSDAQHCLVALSARVKVLEELISDFTADMVDATKTRGIL